MTKILETDEYGALTIPPELLAERHPHSRYTVEQSGSTLRIKPERAPVKHNPKSKEWIVRWKDLSSRIGSASASDKSSVDILSEMRR